MGFGHFGMADCACCSDDPFCEERLGPFPDYSDDFSSSVLEENWVVFNPQPPASPFRPNNGILFSEGNGGGALFTNHILRHWSWDFGVHPAVETEWVIMHGPAQFPLPRNSYDVTFAPGNNGLQCHALTILMSDGEPSPFTPPSDFLVVGGTGIGFAVGQRFAMPNGTTIRCRMNLVSASGDPDDPFMVVYVQWWIGGERVLNYFPRPENATHPGERYVNYFSSTWPPCNMQHQIIHRYQGVHGFDHPMGFDDVMIQQDL